MSNEQYAFLIAVSTWKYNIEDRDIRYLKKLTKVFKNNSPEIIAEHLFKLKNNG